MNKPDLHEGLRLRQTMGVWDDFLLYVSTDLWTTTKDAGMAVAVADGAGGILTLTGDTTLNDEAYVALTTQVFKFTSTGSMVAECLLQYTEANTNNAIVAFGFMSGVGADSLVDTTGEPKSSFSGAIIYKIAGGTQFKSCSSIGTTQTKNQSDTTAGTASAYQRLKIEIMPVSSTVAEVTYYVDGVQLKTAGGRPGASFIKDEVTYTGAVVMGLFVGLKQGSATNAETLNVDYVGAEFMARTTLAA